MAHNDNKENTARIYRPLFLDTKSGFPTGIPNGAIIEVAGVAGPSFSVGGRELLFADGSTTGGGTANALNLQWAYRASAASSDHAFIELLPGKDLVIDSPTGPGISFKIDADTGTVTIGGDLVIGGKHTVVNSTTYQSDNLRLTAQSPNLPALWVGPAENQNAPTSDLVRITVEPGSTSSVFRVDTFGTTIAAVLEVLGDLTVGGKINGVDVKQLSAQLQSHIYVNNTYKHFAKEINIDPTSFHALPGTVVRSVQTVLEFLDNSINNINAQVEGIHADVDNLQAQVDTIKREEASEPGGFTFIANEPLSEWVIEHNKNSKNVVFLVFDESGFMFQPNSAQLVDDNTVILKFGAPQAGRVNMMFYKSNLF